MYHSIFKEPSKKVLPHCFNIQIKKKKAKLQKSLIDSSKNEETNNYVIR